MTYKYFSMDFSIELYNIFWHNIIYKFIKVYMIIIYTRRMLYMEYTKPAVIKAEKVEAAKCGDGPCGRPCGQRA